MYKNTTLTALLLLAFASPALADGRLIDSIKFENKTSAELPLSFKVQKVKWKSEKIRIWAVVENTGTLGYRSVSVSFTALDKERNFLGRNKWYVDPMELAAGDYGFVDDKWIDTEGRVPAIIQYRVTGSPE